MQKNEFYLGALDLSPYIMSVYHRNHFFFQAIFYPYMPDGISDELYLISSQYTSRYASLGKIPLFIRYINHSFGLMVYCENEFINHEMVFGISMFSDMYSMLALCPMQFLYDRTGVLA